MTLLEKWLAAVDKKNSVLCAGIDPPEAAMGHKNSLPERTNKLRWAEEYITSVAPYCAAIKPNLQFWKNPEGYDELGGMTALRRIGVLAHDLGLLVIDDSKVADIGATNDAGVFYAQNRPVDAVTYSPFPGNMEEFGKQCKARGVGGIAMCLMSNPQYKAEKNAWKDVSDDTEGYQRLLPQITMIEGVAHVRQYIKLARDAQRFGLDGIVIGAPSKDNHITEDEVFIASKYAGENMLALVPGVGTQQGEADILFKYFGSRAIVNVGGGLMFPKSGTQAEAAKHYKELFNEIRSRV